MNKPLFRKIIKAIRAEPLRMSMSTWANTGDSIAPCGTTGCIAGFAVILSHGQPKYWKRTAQRLIYRQDLWGFDWEEEAAKVLQIGEEQATRLFYESGWPYRFKARMFNTTNRQQESKVVIARIEHFIKTGK